ncbi:MAG: MATE family efflux transporter, partial [Vallitaleaceae bacterium]|nr:MATE family efflux transporter [Vallitaleaceae bacterium]
MKKDSRFILEGSLYKVIITLALPIMLNNLIGSLYNLGDAFWVSKLGDIEVAAISFVWPVSSLALSIASGMAIAGGAIISQYIGASQIDDAKETVQQLYVFGVLFGILSAVIGW